MWKPPASPHERWRSGVVDELPEDATPIDGTCWRSLVAAASPGRETMDQLVVIELAALAGVAATTALAVQAIGGDGTGDEVMPARAMDRMNGR